MPSVTHPEPGQSFLDARIAAASIEERVAWSARKRALGIRLVWQQADEAGIHDPVEQAEFMLRRLYPEMPEAWLGHVVARLARARAEGVWQGFERPTGV